MSETPEAVKTTEKMRTTPTIPTTPTATEHNGVSVGNPIDQVNSKSKGLPVINPTGTWPPPVYIRPEASNEEIYYMEYRWHSQWSYYDQQALIAKKNYQRIQLTITVGSAAVPVLVGIQALDPTLDMVLYVTTIVISFLVAAASAIETVKQYGDAWRNYRASTEELQREKTLYDMQTGPYRRSKNPFLLFVERSEDIMAKQNGSWAALKEQQVQQQAAATEDTNTTASSPGSSLPTATSTEVAVPTNGSDGAAG